VKLQKSLYLALAAFVAACGTEPEDPPDNGGGTPPPPPPPPASACASPVDIALQPGQHVLVNPSQGGGCVRFPAAGTGGAEYLYAAVATNGTESQLGSSVSYRLTGAAEASVTNEGALWSASLPAAVDQSLGAF
jgi:hypothetical protein